MHVALVYSDTTTLNLYIIMTSMMMMNIYSLFVLCEPTENTEIRKCWAIKCARSHRTINYEMGNH